MKEKTERLAVWFLDGFDTKAALYVVVGFFGIASVYMAAQGIFELVNR